MNSTLAQRSVQRVGQIKVKGRPPHRMLTFRWTEKADRNGKRIWEAVAKTKDWV